MGAYTDIIFRTLAIYLFIVGAIRLFGKTELAQLTVFDLVFILLISNSVQNAMVGPDTSLAGGMFAAGSLFVLNYLLKRITFSNTRINTFLLGEPVMVVHNGRFLREHMKHVHITEEEMQASIREHGISDVSEVDLAILETDGNISILSDNYKVRTVRKRKSKHLSKRSGEL